MPILIIIVFLLTRDTYDWTKVMDKVNFSNSISFPINKHTNDINDINTPINAFIVWPYIYLVVFNRGAQKYLSRTGGSNPILTIYFSPTYHS